MGVLETLKSTLGRVFFPNGKAAREGRIARHWKRALDKHQNGRYLESELEFTRAIRIAEEYGPQSPALVQHLDRLADFYHSTGRYSEAEELFRRVLEIKSANFGPDAYEVAPAINNLALLHYAQGRCEEGEALFERLLPLLTEQLGECHLEIAICLENYAAVLRKLRRDSEASQLQSRATGIRRELKK